jgi:hypothetical protein
MKYLIQGMVMLADLMIIAAVFGLLYSCFTIRHPLVWIISIILLFSAYKVWDLQGGLFAWTKEGRKSFFTGWDKIMKG